MILGTKPKLFRRLLVAGLVASFAVPAFVAAQDLPDISGEAKRELRDEYFAKRRQKPGDPNFDISKARYEAIQMMKEQKQQMRLEGVPPGPVWDDIGPGPITGGQTPTFEPRFPSDVSGRMNAIVIDETDGPNGTVYVGGAQGGVWKSTDNGASWRAVSDDLDSIAVGSLALDRTPHNDGEAILYLGTGEANGSCDSYGGYGVYKSTDSGETWTGPLGETQFSNRAIASIAIDRNDATHIFAGSDSAIFGTSCDVGPLAPDRGIYESTDSGATWAKVTTGNFRTSLILQDPVTDTLWWGAMKTSSLDPNSGGLLKSTDNGSTWTQIAGTGGLPAFASWGRGWITGTTPAVAAVAGVDSVLYVANGISSGSIWKSTDSGTTWTSVPAATGYCGGQCGYDMPIYVEPGDPDVLYTGGAGDSTVGQLPSQFMRSDNGGTTFADKVRSADMTTALHADVHAITTWPGQPNRLWTGNDGGMWRSNDRGDNWINVNNNLQTTQFSGCDLHPTDAMVAYGGTQDNGTMGRLGPKAWKHLDFGDGGFALIDQGNPDNLVHTYFNSTNVLIGVGYTTVGFNATQGQYLGSFASGNGIEITDRVLFYAPIHLDRGNTDTLYFGTHKLYRADNFFAAGGPFTALGGGIDLAPVGGALSAIETVKNGSSNANVLFTGADTGAVFRSTNGGASWTQVDVGGSPLYVSDILVDPSNTSVVYQSRSGFSGVAGQHVRKSTDGGSTWAVAGSGLPDIPVNALAFDPVDGSKIWAGTDIGTYSSTDGGASWLPDNEGMPVVAVFDMKWNSDTESLIACTHGRSTFFLGPIFTDGFESGDCTDWSTGGC